MAFPVAAALLLARRPGNAIGRVLGVVGVGAGVVFTLYWYAVTFPDAPGSRLAEALSSAAVMTQFWGTLALLHLFPTGRPLSGSHRRAVTVLNWFAAVVAGVALVTDPLTSTGRANPIGFALAKSRRSASTPGSRPTPGPSYQGPWRLLGPDSHRPVMISLQVAQEHNLRSC